MEIRVLKYFLAVAREQSFSAAAESLYLSQPTLSRQLSDLEKELGKPLFVRGYRKVMLTEEGMILRKRAEEIIELLEKTEQEIIQTDENVRGTIYIGAGETYAISIIIKSAQKLQKQFPNIHYNMFSGDGQDVSEKLDKGLIDFGVLFEPMDISHYNSIEIPACDTLGVLMRKDSPLAEQSHITAEHLKHQPLIVPRPPVNNSVFTTWFGTVKDDLNIIAEYNLVYNASVMVTEGMGYAICFDKLINVSGDSNLCFRPFSPNVYAKCHLVWKKYPVFTKAAEKFLQQFREDVES